jgi:hypothetical protein
MLRDQRALSGVRVLQGVKIGDAINALDHDLAIEHEMFDGGAGAIHLLVRVDYYSRLQRSVSLQLQIRTFDYPAKTLPAGSLPAL